MKAEKIVPDKLVPNKNRNYCKYNQQPINKHNLRSFKTHNLVKRIWCNQLNISSMTLQNKILFNT